MKLRFLGGAREIGRSAIQADDLLLDYGVMTDNPPQYPIDSTVEPDAIVASHGHLDHVGAIPTLMTDLPPVHQTPPTRDLIRVLVEDTLEIVDHLGRNFNREDVLRLSQTAETHGYEEIFTAGGFDVTLHDAGHIPGSASVLVEGDTSLLYTGDLNTLDTRLLTGAEPPPPADVLVVESTYYGREHTPREELERSFVESVRETLWEGGDVIIPVFSIGRTQEILMVLEEFDVPCSVDGMGCEVTELLRHHPSYLRDPEALKRAWNHARRVDPGKRDRVLGEGRAVVTTSGMLTGGPAMYYVKEIHRDPVNKIALTGYQVEGTPGREALETGSAPIDGTVIPISAQVELYDFSAHADDTGLKQYVRDAVDAGVERVFCVHGTEHMCTGFRDWVEDELGVEAEAPERGLEVVV